MKQILPNTNVKNILFKDTFYSMFNEGLMLFIEGKWVKSYFLL